MDEIDVCELVRKLPERQRGAIVLLAQALLSCGEPEAPGTDDDDAPPDNSDDRTDRKPGCREKGSRRRYDKAAD